MKNYSFDEFCAYYYKFGCLPDGSGRGKTKLFNERELKTKYKNLYINGMDTDVVFYLNYPLMN